MNRPKDYFTITPYQMPPIGNEVHEEMPSWSCLTATHSLPVNIQAWLDEDKTFSPWYNHWGKCNRRNSYDMQ